MDAIAEREFDQRNCKVIGISADGVDDRLRWSEDIRAFRGRGLNFPLIGDPTLRIAKAYDLLPAERYPHGWESPLPYLHLVEQPT